MNHVKTVSFTLQNDGIIPNNQVLPVILYKGALSEKTEQIEAIFNKHNWRNSWTNGIYDYHHYHSNSHEVLGIIRGSGELLLGGEQGRKVMVAAGDVIVLPAGTGHKKITANSDFQVVGAYPGGSSYNLRKGTSDLPVEILVEINEVPLPLMDPVYGRIGPLTDKWSLDPA